MTNNFIYKKQLAVGILYSFSSLSLSPADFHFLFYCRI
nr:MAG TPA: hypothetical protein [Caudoviricetes sp.]